jgi:excisionase family DNA binding protein
MNTYTDNIRGADLDDDTNGTSDYSSEVRCPGTVLTVEEACRTLRISRWMLYKLIHERRIKTFKLGARRLIPASAVDELIGRLQAEEAA